MNNKIYKRVKNEAIYIINTKKTIREIAKLVKVSKSTVHKDLQDRLPEIDINLYRKVQEILQYHLEIRHINGGNATKLKYEKLRKG
mgnify:FL=1